MSNRKKSTKTAPKKALPSKSALVVAPVSAPAPSKKATGSTASPLLKISEVKSLVEEIMKRIMVENRVEEKLDLQSLCKIVMGDQLSEFRQEINRIESNLLWRIASIEERSSEMMNSIADLRNKVQNSAGEQSKADDQEVNLLLKDNRRMQDENFEKLRNDFHSTSSDINAKISSVRKEVKTCAAEIVKVNDVLTVRTAPETASNNFEVAGIVATLSRKVMSLESRLQQIESTTTTAGGGGGNGQRQSSADDGYSTSNHTQLRREGEKKGVVTAKTASSAEANNSLVQRSGLPVSDLTDRMKIYQDDVNKLKDHYKSLTAAIDRQEARLKAQEAASAPMQQMQIKPSVDIAGLKQRVSILGMKTATACQAIAGSLSELQQHSVDMLDWSEKVHSSFGVVSEKLFLSRNICPRPKVLVPAAANAPLRLAAPSSSSPSSSLRVPSLSSAPAAVEAYHGIAKSVQHKYPGHAPLSGQKTRRTTPTTYYSDTDPIPHTDENYVGKPTPSKATPKSTTTTGTGRKKVWYSSSSVEKSYGPREDLSIVTDVSQATSALRSYIDSFEEQHQGLEEEEDEDDNEGGGDENVSAYINSSYAYSPLERSCNQWADLL